MKTHYFCSNGTLNHQSERIKVVQNNAFKPTNSKTKNSIIYE